MEEKRPLQPPEPTCENDPFAMLGATNLGAAGSSASNTLSVRAVLRHSVDTRRDGHGQHAEQKASEDLQDRMAGRAAVAQIPDREEQYARDKDTDHVRAVLRR